jgi:site-specific DNA recombinase
MTKQTLAVGYCRVSTDKQDISLKTQEAQIRAMAVVKGWELTEVVVDDAKFSGNLDRAGVQRVLEMVRKRQVEAVIIAKLDRLTRSTRDVIALIELMNKKKVALVSLSESLDTRSAMGRFFVRMIASLGELERENIGDRTRSVMAHMRQRNLPVGPAPYGWRSPGVGRNESLPFDQKAPLVLDKEEQKIVKRILDMRTGEQALSLRKIAARLNGMGITTRSGSPWRHQYIDTLLRRVEARA